MSDARRSIVLIGPMGTGKTSVGRRLAARLGRAFVDVDEEVARAAGRGIPEIFAEEGEEGFRRRETEALRRILARPGRVVATGGGCVTREENWDLFGGSRVIALWTSPERIYERLRRSPVPLEQRPLLAGPDPLGRLRELAERRRSLYERADLWIEVEGEGPDEVAERIARELGARCAR